MDKKHLLGSSMGLTAPGHGFYRFFNKARRKGRSVIARMLGRLKDLRRVATRHDKNAESFLAALCLAALVCYWIRISLDPRMPDAQRWIAIWAVDAMS